MEFMTKVLNVDANMQAEITKWAAEGWQLVPGCIPQAVYQLYRQSKVSGSMGKLVIDDSKVHVVRAGEPFPQDKGDKHG